MGNLNKKIKDVSDDAENLIVDYLKLFSLKQTEKLALLLGILSSVFILATLLLIVVVFCSIAFAGYLNHILNDAYLGFWIVGGFYVLLILLLILKMMVSKTPLLSNIFVKFIAGFLSLDLKNERNIKGLKWETQLINEKITSEKVKITYDFKAFRFSFIELIISGIMNLFSSKNDKSTNKSESED